VSVLVLGLVVVSSHAQTFSNTAAITINDYAPATPYPSDITVSGITSFSAITVALNA
jgi:hypothetical protein